MRILVTGSSGYIGSKVIPKLLDLGHEVMYTSRSDSVRKFSWYDDKSNINLDFSKLQDFDFQAIGNVDLLIDLAWGHLDDFRSEKHISEELFYHYDFIKNMILAGVKDIVVLGTCLEYGLLEGELYENMLANPVIEYAIAKDSLRRFIESYNKNHEFSFKWIRLFYNYSYTEDKIKPNSILDQLSKAIKNGETTFNMSKGDQLRDYLDIDEVVDYIVKLSLQKKILGIINCSSGKAISVNSLVENYVHNNNITINLNRGYYSYSEYEPFSFWGNNDKLNEILNKNESKD